MHWLSHDHTNIFHLHCSFMCIKSDRLKRTNKYRIKNVYIKSLFSENIYKNRLMLNVLKNIQMLNSSKKLIRQQVILMEYITIQIYYKNTYLAFVAAFLHSVFQCSYYRFSSWDSEFKIQTLAGFEPLTTKIWHTKQTKTQSAFNLSDVPLLWCQDANSESVKVWHYQYR